MPGKKQKNKAGSGESPKETDWKNLLRAPNLTLVQSESIKQMAPARLFKRSLYSAGQFIGLNDAQKADLFSRSRQLNFEWAKCAFAAVPELHWMLVLDGIVIDGGNDTIPIPSWHRIVEIAISSKRIPLLFFRKWYWATDPGD